MHDRPKGVQFTAPPRPEYTRLHGAAIALPKGIVDLIRDGPLEMHGAAYSILDLPLGRSRSQWVVIE